LPVDGLRGSCERENEREERERGERERERERERKGLSSTRQAFLSALMR